MDFWLNKTGHLAGILFWGFVLYSCGAEKNAAPAAQPDKPDTLTASAAANPPGPFDYSNTVLTGNFCDTVFHVFSDTATPDRFTFFVPAGNITETKAILRIVTANGRLLYEDVFPTTDLISGYDLEANVHNDEQMQDYLQKKEKEVLDVSAFVPLNPIKDQVLLQYLETEEKNQTAGISTGSEFENYPVFALAQKENRPLFVYALNEENIRYLGYSPKLKKAVMVTSCC